jgi:hypothetical protein
MTRRINFLGKLPAAVVASLPLEVQQARAAYLSDTQQEINDMFVDLGVSAFVPSYSTESLDAMIERGYQFDSEGRVYEPEIESANSPGHKRRGGYEVTT